jgi:hypothetical protein
MTATASTAVLVSLALPWALEWSGRRTVGASVLFFSDDYRPHLGVPLLVLWSVAVVGAARGTRAWRWLAVVAAVGVVAICPVYYWAAITRIRGTAWGWDGAGNAVEWTIQGQAAVGLYVAVIGTALLFLGVLMRCRYFGFDRKSNRVLGR